MSRTDIVHLAVGNMDKARNIAAQVKQGVHLHRRLGGSEMRPRKRRQAEIDRCRVQRVDRLLEIDAQTVICVQAARLSNQPMSELSINPPIARFVCIRKRRAANRLAETDTDVVEFVRPGRQAGFDVARTLAIGQLRERQCPKLFSRKDKRYPSVISRACPANRTAVINLLSSQNSVSCGIRSGPGAVV
jgi:hypothetical protein